MLYKLAADFVVVIHFLWILFIIFGAFWGKYSRVVKYIHIGGLIFSIVSQIFFWICPLTHLEVWLEEHYNPSLAYPGSFITHYLDKIIYIQISERIIFVLTLAIVGISGLAYWKYPASKGPDKNKA